METDFGADTGSKYVVRSLATLAFLRQADQSLRDELLAALEILQNGEATRATLQGSWAGAMGQPQFLPSAYAKYAVSFAGGQAPDIWQSIPDSLASIANFLKLAGWQRGLPWGAEVNVPAGFDYASLQQRLSGLDRARISRRRRECAARRGGSNSVPAGGRRRTRLSARRTIIG